MKILACIEIGGKTIKGKWEFEPGHLIIARLGAQSIAIPIDMSRVDLLEQDGDRIYERLNSGPQKDEYFEATIDSLDRAYLGQLRIEDAVLIPAN